MAGGLQVGHCLASWQGGSWTAYLWAEQGDPRMGYRGEVKAGNLAELRWKVGQRLDDWGPWWVVPSETAATREAG